MILHQEKLNVEGGFAPKREKSFGIAPSMIGHVMKILSDMYSDPYRAIAREYIANAVDSHRMARKLGRTPSKNIEITTPNKLNPVFSVRDYGVGMTEEETEELLSNFGSSGEEKRKDDTLIGGFGIGSKCAFAVTDSYTFTVWRGGRERMWLCTIKQDAARSIQMLTDRPSTEPTGVKVEVPVKWEMSSRVGEGVVYVLSCLDEPFVLDDISFTTPLWKYVPLTQGVSLAYLGTPVDIHVNNRVICGDFHYEIPDRTLEVAIGYDGRQRLREFAKLGTGGSIPNLDLDKSPFLAALMSPTCCFKFEGGMLRPAPNRENIIFDTASEKYLKTAYDALVKHVTDEVQKVTTYANSPLDVLRVIEALEKTSLSTLKVRPEFQGKKITFDDLPAIKPREGVKVYFPYIKRQRRSRNHTSKTESLEAKLTELSTHAYQNREDVTRMVSREYAEMNGALYTKDQLVVIEAEEMGVGHLAEAVRAWWRLKIEEAVAAGTAHAYDDFRSYDINQRHVIVMGTEAERKAEIANMAWCTKSVDKTPLVKPPKVARAPRAQGAPRAESDPISSRGWMCDGLTNFEKCFRPEAGTEDDPVGVVYVIDRPDAAIAREIQELRKDWTAQVVPGFADTKIYALTQDAYDRIKDNKEFQMIPLHEAMTQWLNDWCKADKNAKAFGAEMYAMFGCIRTIHSSDDVPKGGEIDEWELSNVNDLISFIDERGYWWKQTSAMQGEFKKLAERILLRAGDQPKAFENIVNGIGQKMNTLRVVTDFAYYTANPKTEFSIKADACKALKEKVNLLLTPIRKFLKDKPERAALIHEQVRTYRHEVGQMNKWNASLFEAFNKG